MSLDHIALQLDREGIKGREDGERGGGGGGVGLFERGNEFRYFRQRGQLFKGCIFEEIWYLLILL